MVLADIITQHAEEAAILWIIRDRAVRSPQYTRTELTALDCRIEAHLDGLRIAGDSGWESCVEMLCHEGPGEVFAAGVLALESGEQRRFDEVIDVALKSPVLLRALVSAHGWVSYRRIESHIKGLFVDRRATVRRIGIAASAIHRRDPGHALEEGIRSADSHLQARALRAVGELGRTDLIPLIRDVLKCGDESCRYWAAWSGTLLGAEEAVDVMESFVKTMATRWEEGAEVLFRRMESARSRRWFEEASERSESYRAAVTVAGILGYPDAIDWLLERMAEPALARLSGQATSMITGIDLRSGRFEGKKPTDFESGPTENPEDDDVDPDPDGDLPWPDAVCVRAWWDGNKGLFDKGRRYLLGRPVSPEWVPQVIMHGTQRIRASAAVEYALMHPGNALIDVRAPGFRQVRSFL